MYLCIIPMRKPKGTKKKRPISDVECGVRIVITRYDRLPANGHVLDEIFSRKRIKNIIQLCIE